MWDQQHDDVIKWKHFPRYWPFVRGIHMSPVNSPHRGQWRRALMFSLICAWINGWKNNRKGGYLRRHSAHYDVTVMTWKLLINGLLWWESLPKRPVMRITFPCHDTLIQRGTTEKESHDGVHFIPTSQYSRKCICVYDLPGLFVNLNILQ